MSVNGFDVSQFKGSGMTTTEQYEDTQETQMAWQRLGREADERIQLHLIDGKDFNPGNPLIDLIQATGILLT